MSNVSTIAKQTIALCMTLKCMPGEYVVEHPSDPQDGRMWKVGSGVAPKWVIDAVYGETFNQIEENDFSKQTKNHPKVEKALKKRLDDYLKDMTDFNKMAIRRLGFLMRVFHIPFEHFGTRKKPLKHASKPLVQEMAIYKSIADKHNVTPLGAGASRIAFKMTNEGTDYAVKVVWNQCVKNKLTDNEIEYHAWKYACMRRKDLFNDMLPIQGYWKTKDFGMAVCMPLAKPLDCIKYNQFKADIEQQYDDINYGKDWSDTSLGNCGLYQNKVYVLDWNIEGMMWLKLPQSFMIPEKEHINDMNYRHLYNNL